MTWNMPADEGADAAGQEHVAELRDRRVREDLLDVVLHEADRRREERREGADDRDDDHRVGREAEEHVAARDHVDAGRHHRGGVDQRRDGRRPGHRVRQPDVERELRRLAARPDEEAAGRRAVMYGAYAAGLAAAAAKTFAKSSVPKSAKIAEDPEDEAEVADPVDDERLLAGVGRELLLVVVPDQQVRAEPDALPPDEEHQEVAAEDEHEHREHEEVQVREVAPVALLVPHVARRSRRGSGSRRTSRTRASAPTASRAGTSTSTNQSPTAPGICPTAWFTPSGIQR